MDYKVIGAKIRQCRLQCKMKQSDLAEKTNLSASFVGHIERGTRTASLESIVAIADVLGVTVDELLPLNHEKTEIAPADVDAAKKLLIMAIELAGTGK